MEIVGEERTNNTLNYVPTSNPLYNLMLWRMAYG